jgi:hypothetical protein
MSFAVKCPCGNVLNVRDEFLDRQVECQVCHTCFTASPIPDAPEPVAAAFSAPATASAGLTCPFCAEAIPEAAVFCPLCGKSLSGKLTTAQGAQLAAAASAQLDAYVADPDNLAADNALRGRLLSVMSIVLGILAATCIGMIVAGAFVQGDGGGLLIGFGICLGFIFLISLQVSVSHDYSASHIRDAKTPQKALRRYFIACKTGRYKKAFACLAPSARNGAMVRPLKFAKFPSDASESKIEDLAGFCNYCRTIFIGPSSHQRVVHLNRFELEAQLPDGTAWVKAGIQFNSFPKGLYLFALLGPAVCLLIIAVVAHNLGETKTLRKCLFRRGDRWYVAEADFEGPLDKAAPAFSEG